jgi:hypothetical protein
MTGFVTANRVRETTSTTGTGDLILAGAVSGHRSFGSIPGIAHGDPLYYCAVASNGQWEEGHGMYMTLFGPAVPRIARQVSKDGSSGAGVAVNFAVAPDVFITHPAEESRVRGARAFVRLSANQVITAGAAAVKVNFNTDVVNLSGNAAAGLGWNTASQTCDGFNEPGWRNIRAKVDATTTFAGDSYLAIFLGGVEQFRGPTLNGSKSLWVEGDLWLAHTDQAEVRIFSTTGGTILGGSSHLSHVLTQYLPGPQS